MAMQPGIIYICSPILWIISSWKLPIVYPFSLDWDLKLKKVKNASIWRNLHYVALNRIYAYMYYQYLPADYKFYTLPKLYSRQITFQIISRFPFASAHYHQHFINLHFPITRDSCYEIKTSWTNRLIPFIELVHILTHLRRLFVSAQTGCIPIIFLFHH